jgi:hypothetical protein
MADIDTSPEAVERAARGAWMAHQQTAADTLRALACERNVALGQSRYIAKALEAAANQRDEALAREAALREALTRAADDLSLYARHGITAFHGERAARDALTNTATVAAARDAALVERGRREGIEEAARVAHEMAELRAVEYHAGSHDHSREYAEGAMDASGEIADAIAHRASVAHRALATPPADGGPR